jgi:putative NADPH-quinone reductase
MSKALIIYGYYDEKDHYGELLDAIKAQLEKAHFESVEVINTFGFSKGHLSNNEKDFTASTADWYRGLRTSENDALIKEQQNKILAATHLVFVFPIWWESLPPFMMSWVSEVFRSVSFRVDNTGRPNPQWGGNRKVMILTTAGFNETVRRENFARLLPTRNLQEIQDNPGLMDKIIQLSQTYPLTMALNYAGLTVTEEAHICGVDKGNEPSVISQVEKSVQAFIKAVSKSEDPVLLASSPLLLSGGPGKVYAASSTPGVEQPNAEQPLSTPGVKQPNEDNRARLVFK